MIFNEIKKAVQSALDFLHPIIDSKEPKTFKGTTAEWSNLTPAEQAAYEVKYITDDVATIPNFHYQSGTDNHPQETAIQTGYQTHFDVTFPSAFPDTGYDVIINPLRVESVVSVANKTTTGFRYYIRAVESLQGDFGVNWSAFKIPR